MSQEIELKLALDRSSPERLGLHPALQGTEPGAGLLTNTYYDTPEGDLERARVALRIREANGERLQTLKTSGHGSGGLSIRGEWEWPVTGPGLDIAGLKELPPMRGLDARVFASLAPRFRTDFRRRTWQLERGGSQIELALDIGEIVAGERRTAICEAELELKGGEVAALWQLATELADETPLRPAMASKAARGSALREGNWQLPDAGATPQACFERAIAALDAFDDSGEAPFKAAARDALHQLAALDVDRTVRQHANTLAEALSEEAWLNRETGRSLVALARTLHSGNG